MPIDWDAERYLAFAAPRLRPALDLLARIPMREARTVVDLGCGSGNLVPHLRRRYAQARIIGIDASRDMLARARAAHPDLTFVEADLRSWEPDAAVDLIFSNAALQWLDDHQQLLPRLMTMLRPGSVLAVQMGNNGGAASHRLVGEIAADGPWSERLRGRYRPLPELAAAPYYRWLAPLAEDLDIWETEYLHALEGEEPVFDWARSSTLLPALAHLDEDEAARFLDRYREALRRAYPREADGRTLLPFRRLFIVATAKG
ncbi:MAG TPA: methyltransferase domain-containing protein [Geminicoccaceae bacterium]|nr:methyltransferase domain-containing protein [Geminicoccaceae bacterium]